ncbi:MAG TPA: hypothetical protein VFJ58_25010 [Armatimonadota bacterium]|nr:hypothetical protein [Armatimonadota bacterium]
MLPGSEVLQALDIIFDLHSNLGRSGWIASDFYDGCLMYDFKEKWLHIVDLDNYRRAPFHNTMGRMFGSTRSLLQRLRLALILPDHLPCRNCLRPLSSTGRPSCRIC